MRSAGFAATAFLVGSVLSAISPSPVSALGVCGPTWSFSAVQAPTEQVFQVALNGLSLTPSGGWTVGGVTDRANVLHAFADYFDGSGWSEGAPVDAPHDGADTWLNDVVTFGDGNAGAEAWAVGYGGPSSTLLRPQAIVEHWTGPSPTSPWELSTPEVDGAYSNLVSVDASGPSDVFAVGSRRTGAAYRALILHSAGGAWRQIKEATLPAGTLQSGLVSISVASPDDAWAVGWRTSGSGYDTLAEHWDGSTWKVVQTPNPGSVENVLLGVAAAGGKAFAVGYSDDGNGVRPLVMRFDGRAWSNADAPATPQPLAVLRSATLAPNGRVWVAGFGSDPARGFSPFIATADPTASSLAWTSTPPATVNGIQGRELKDIEAEPTGNQIWAVGSAGPPMAETICPPSTLSAASFEASAPQASEPKASAPQASESQASDPEPSAGESAPRAASHAKAQLTVAADVSATALPGEPDAVMTNGATVGDVAGPGGPGPDGYPDLLIGRFGDGPLELWINQQDGTWRLDGDTPFGVADRYGCTVADLASARGASLDGIPDIFCTIGAAKGTGLSANELWVQAANGSFSRSGAQREVLQPFGRGRVAAAFVPGNHKAAGSQPQALFVGVQMGRGDGVPNPNRFLTSSNGRLVDTPASGLDIEIGASCAQPVDYDHDGLTDVLVCTNIGFVALFHNEGERGGIPRFDEVSGDAKLAQGGIVSATAVDLNRDRCADVVEVFAGRLDVLLQSASGRGDCDGTFARRWSRPLDDGVAVAAGDVNGDRRPDLYVLQRGSADDVMLLNDGRQQVGFSSVPIPQASGSGDDVDAVRNPDTRLSDFLVLNGDHTHGPVQLIRFSTAPRGVRISSGPPRRTSSTTARFAFGGSVGSGYVCSMDGADPKSCTSGVRYKHLDEGRHRFAVWAVDSDGAPLAEDTSSFKVIR